jgi:hypothetical protein
LIKVAYLHKEKEEQQELYDKFIKDGGVAEDFSPAPDQLNERFQMAFNIYREKKQRFNEDLEKKNSLTWRPRRRFLNNSKRLSVQKKR